MNLEQLASAITAGKYDTAFAALYGSNDIPAARGRYLRAVEGYREFFGDTSDVNVRLFSVPGRSEILGNHTDHNYGRVIAASINLDIIAVAAARADMVVRVKSEGFPADEIDIADGSVKPSENGTSAAILRGVAANLRSRGFAAGGFNAYTTSDVLKGSGLSSSAAFEVMAGKIQSALYNSDRVTPIQLAQIGQAAENAYFGKPCGLMDQTACASGGFVTIDFADPANPVVEKLSFDLTSLGIYLCITDTGGNHADLTGDYAAIPTEMKSVARLFGQYTLRGLTVARLWEKTADIRRISDRAFLRAIHFIEENDRVGEAVEAIRIGDLAAFLGFVTASGNSSFKYLQNIFTVKAVDEQGVSLALAASEHFLRGRREGACRVHGGGFAGTIQAFVSGGDVDVYAALMDGIFGKGACHILKVRDAGAFELKE